MGRGRSPIDTLYNIFVFAIALSLPQLGEEARITKDQLRFDESDYSARHNAHAAVVNRMGLCVALSARLAVELLP